MPTPAELNSKFASFPTPDHVQTVCRPGQGAQTCRYLSIGPGRDGVRYGCEKATSVRQTIDQRIKEGTMNSRGDNCRGILGFIADNQADLIGNKAVHHEDGEDTEETFTGINLGDRAVGVVGFGIAEDFAQVTVTQEGLVFTAPYLGYATVYFEKPQQAPAE